MVDDIERQAYYGGVTQAFSHAQQHQVKYIDVNSLYPAAMTKIKVSRTPAVRAAPFSFMLHRDNNFMLSEWALYLVDKF